MSDNLNKPRENTGTVPGLLDTFAVILISSAVVIFIFWLSSQAVGTTLFQQLPAFVTDSFKAVWTSVATGTGGIGFALFRAFKYKNTPSPNYLKLVGFTSFGLILSAVMLMGYTQQILRHGIRISMPPEATVVSLENSGPTKFDLEEPKNMPFTFITYVLKGKFEVHSHEVTGHLLSGKIAVQSNAPANFPTRITALSFRVSFIHRVNGDDAVDSYPAAVKTDDSIAINLKLSPGESYDLDPCEFHFDLPPDQTLDRAWLSAQIFTEMPYQYFPAQ